MLPVLAQQVFAVVFRVMVFHHRVANVHGREQGKDIGLKRSYQQFHEVHKQAEHHDQGTDPDGLEEEDDA